jgi:Site-specific recombinase XerD
VARGSIRQRGEKTWQIRVYKLRDGERKRYLTKTVRGLRAEAEAECARLVAQVWRERTASGDADIDTVGQLLESWYAVGLGRWEPGMAQRERRNLDLYVLPALGTLEMGKLDRRRVEQFYAGLSGRGLMPRTVARVHGTLHAGLEAGVEWGVMTVNPARKARRAKVARTTAIGQGVDVGRLLEVPMGTDHAMYLRLALATGARRGELCGLQWGDVDLERRVVEIRRRVVEGLEGLVVVGGTKGGPGRAVCLDEETVEVLRGHRTRARERALAVGARLEDGAFVFSRDPAGRTHWGLRPVTAWFGRLSRRAGVPVTLHGLRRLHATRLLQAGVDLKVVAQRLGHADGTMTLHYARPDQEAHRLAAEVAGRLLSSRS